MENTHLTQQILERISPDTCRVTCQRCSISKVLPTQKLAHLDRPLEVKCRCGHQFQVVHDRRQHTRKALDLVGYVFEPSTKTICDTLTLIDLSIGGAGFVTQELSPQVGETFTLGFFLDDASQAWIEADVIVQNVYHENVIGTAFADSSAYNFDLDFYLSAFSVVEKSSQSD